MEIDGSGDLGSEACRRFFETAREWFPDTDAAVGFLRQQARSDDNTRVSALYCIAVLEGLRHHDPIRRNRQACARHLLEVVESWRATDRVVLSANRRHVLDEAMGISMLCLGCLNVMLQPEGIAIPRIDEEGERAPPNQGIPGGADGRR
jgi:hypothetical protein